MLYHLKKDRAILFMKNTYFESPDNISYRDFTKPSVFLAGSIEQGKAVDWQSLAKEELIKNNFVVFNPRRQDWNAELPQTYVNAQMNQQICWEDNAMKNADAILMYLQPGTLSPISLFEFGKHLKSDKIIMICPEGFWRKANVDYECATNNVPQFDTLEEAINYLKNNIRLI